MHKEGRQRKGKKPIEEKTGKRHCANIYSTKVEEDIEERKTIKT